MGTLRAAALGSVALAFGSCYREPAGEQCTIACTDDNSCPNGLHCLNKYCVPNGVPDEENSCVPPDTTASWTAVSTGARHVCAVTSKGTLWCWGDNHYAQLGFGQLATVAPPTALATDGWTAVTAGNDFTCGVRNKVIYCWGDNRFGQLGSDPSPEPVAEPRRVEVEPGPGADAFAAATVLNLQAGAAHTCALLEAGSERSVWCWGSNESGQLGVDNPNGDTSRQAVKVPVPSSDLASITVGGRLGCALTKGSGELWCWGLNDNKQFIGDGPVAIAPRKLDVLAGAEGRLRSVATNGASICTIVDYANNSVGLLCWGYASFRAATPPDASGHYPTPVKMFPDQLSGWSDLVMGLFYACARNGDGLLQCFGDLQNGEIGNGNWVNNDVSRRYAVPQLDGYAMQFGFLGTRYGCGIKAGALACWGDNRFGQLGQGTSSIAPPTSINAPSQRPWRSAYAAGNNTCAVDVDNKIFCWGADASGAHSGSACVTDGCFTAVPTASAAHPAPVTDVVLGPAHLCALRTDASLYCSGTNSAQQRGPNGTSTNPAVNIVAGVDTEQWLAVQGSNSLVCAQHKPNTNEAADWYCWGTISDATTTLTTPNQLTKLSRPIQQLSAGHYSGAGVTRGYALMRDNNDHKWYGAGFVDGTLPYGVTPLAPPSANYSGLTALNYEGELGLTFDNIKTALLAEELLCGLTSAGKVYCWGSNTTGQVGRTYVPGVDFRVLQPKQASVTFLHATAVCSDISVSARSACAVCKASALEPAQVQCWGDPADGRLGRDQAAIVEPDYMPHTVPLPTLQGSDTWKSVVQGAAHACALSNAGALACWGDSRFGQAGTGTSNVNTPQLILEVLK